MTAPHRALTSTVSTAFGVNWNGDSCPTSGEFRIKLTCVFKVTETPGGLNVKPQDEYMFILLD